MAEVAGDGKVEGGAVAPKGQAASGETTRNKSRRAAKGGRRSKTIARREMLRDRKKFQEDPEVLDLLEKTRPRYRRDCINGIRPCIYVSCKHHLYLDVNPQTGSVKINFPDKEIWELEETCALDVADRGGITLEEVGEILNLTRERIRQVEVNGLRKIQVSTGITDVSGIMDA
jgi:hypothetical protein